MISETRMYRFEGVKKGKELCPICLEELKKSEHIDCFPKGKVVVKKEDYILIKVTKDEAIIQRMLSITKNKKDESKEFIILYVNKIFIGYKGKEKIKFIPEFSEEKYTNILNEYTSRKEKKKKNSSEIKMWNVY